MHKKLSNYPRALDEFKIYSIEANRHHFWSEWVGAISKQGKVWKTEA